MVKYVTSESTLKDGCDASALPDKQIRDKEKQLLEKYKVIKTNSDLFIYLLSTSVKGSFDLLHDQVN